MAYTLAPGLLRAEEQARPPPAQSGQQPAEGSGPDAKGTPQDHSGTQERGKTGWTGGTQNQMETEPGVGSRGLTSPEAQDRAADQPEMATGLDLKGPPMRFPPAETPE